MQVTITGGNGAIARAISDLLTENGYLCFTPSRSELDITDRVSAEQYFANTKTDILINCAGSIVTADVRDSDIDAWILDIQTNLIGTYLCTKFALNNGCTSVVNIGSSAGFHGKANWSAYCAAKAGVASFTQSLALENINAYTVSPGRTQSKMRLGLYPNEDQSTLLTPHEVAQVVFDAIQGKYPVGSNISIKKDEGIQVK